ncbi:MAG: hypothetical protein LBU53_04205 [Zoogloeaceae bacterium]|jgi:hypothetical protein|nr:hypothetical protein [Zoogloeaceae bacterium]
MKKDSRLETQRKLRSVVVFWAVLALALVLLPLDAWACMCVPFTLEEKYEKADAVALVRKSDQQPKIEVLQSWKSELPRAITVREIGQCGGYRFRFGISILYLKWDERREVWTINRCAGHIGESDENYHAHLQWLNQMSK